MCVRVCEFVYVCVSVFVCMCVVCVCIYVCVSVTNLWRHLCVPPQQRELLQSERDGDVPPPQDGSTPTDPPLGAIFTAPMGGTPEPLVPSPFTGESAVRYLTRLALIQRSKEQVVPRPMQPTPEHVVPRPMQPTPEQVVPRPMQPTPEQVVPSPMQPTPVETPGPVEGEQVVKPKEKKPKKKKTKTNRDTPPTLETTSTPKNTPPIPKDTPPVPIDTPPVSVDTPSVSPPPPPSDPPVRLGPKTREEALEERRRKQFPGQRPWPTIESCTHDPPPHHILFTSTWLSVSAKGAKWVWPAWVGVTM